MTLIERTVRRSVVRIALWASGGSLVSVGWGVYFASINKAAPIEAIVYTLARLTQPGAAVFSHFIHGPHGLTQVVLENTAAYALIGFVVETIRRYYQPSHIST